MTDNFNVFKDFINQTEGLPEKDPKGISYMYYVIELMRRGKDNPDLPAANVHFKNYYIYSWEDYNRFEEEIKTLCRTLRMRAYISVNRKDLKRVTLNTIAEMTRRIAEGDYKRIYKTFESCSGKYKERNKNYWIIDIDNEGMTGKYTATIRQLVNNCKSQFDKNVIMQLPTRSGVHIITHPFNKYEFTKKYNEFFKDISDEIKIPDIKENHLTLLFEDL